MYEIYSIIQCLISVCKQNEKHGIYKEQVIDLLISILMKTILQLYIMKASVVPFIG